MYILPSNKTITCRIYPRCACSLFDFVIFSHSLPISLRNVIINLIVALTTLVHTMLAITPTCDEVKQIERT